MGLRDQLVEESAEGSFRGMRAARVMGVEIRRMVESVGMCILEFKMFNGNVMVGFEKRIYTYDKDISIAIHITEVPENADMLHCSFVIDYTNPLYPYYPDKNPSQENGKVETHKKTNSNSNPATPANPQRSVNKPRYAINKNNGRPIK